MKTSSLCPGPSVGSWHVTVVTLVWYRQMPTAPGGGKATPAWRDSPSTDADWLLAPPGSMPLRATLVAVAGPLLDTLTVHVTAEPVTTRRSSDLEGPASPPPGEGRHLRPLASHPQARPGL